MHDRGMVGRTVARTTARFFGVVLTLCVGGTAFAQSPEGDPKTAVRLAKAAFEYRDFERVVTILDPWLHPPRIVDPKLEVKARELLGVSQHVLGRVEAAEEEFAQLLELAPKHELDPFLVPPPVVQTFEEVRAKMKPILDRLIDRPAPDPDPPPVEVRTKVELVEVPHPAIVVTPFGIPQFALGETGWGIMWAGLQAVALAVNIGGWAQSRRVATPAADDRVVDTSALAGWQAVQYGGLAAFVAAWAGSGVHGYFQLDAQRRAATPLAAPTRPTPTAGWRWDF